MFRWSSILTLVLAAAALGQPSAEQLLKQAISEHSAGQFDAAIRDYRAYLKLRPSAVDARSNLGAALAREGHYAEAIVEYREALKLSPRNTPIWVNLAIAYYKSGDIAKAAGELGAIHAQHPDNKQAMLLLADCWLRQGSDGKVIDLLTPFESAADPAIDYMLGTALLRAKQTGRGQRVIDRILRHGDTAESRLLLGTAKYFAHEYPGAIEDLRKAVALNPHLPEANSYLGLSFIEMGDSPSARAAFERELEVNPNDFESNLRLAALVKEAGDYDRALHLLDHALLVRPGDLGALYQVGAVQLAANRLEPARATLERILKQAPDFTEAHVSLAQVYYRLKRKEDGDRERVIIQKLKIQQDAARSAKPASTHQ